MAAEKPVRCACGKEAIAWPSGMVKKYRVCCHDSRCWLGPWRTTQRGAIVAWNKVMGGAK